MSKKISGAEFPLAKIFSSDFDYVIPAYQRPYAWTVDHTSELFDDLYDFYSKEPDEGYFLGSIVLIKNEEVPKAEVIDGQQRLTTLTILLAAIAYSLSGEEQSQFLKYIKEPGNKFEGRDAKPRLTLRERDKEFFTRYVQGLDFAALIAADPSTLANESQKNIRSNSMLMLERIQKNLSDTDGLIGFAGFLVQRCFLVAVSTPSQKSAFRVFSVMNSRGMDLLPTDIIKADVIGTIKDEAKYEEYTTRWEDMEVQTGRSEFSDLFAYIRMVFAKEKAKRALLEEFRTHVLAKYQDPVLLINSVLEPYAEAYSIVKKCSYVSTENAQEVNSYLKWLNRIDNSDWIPSAIFFISKHKANSAYMVWFFQRLERLAAYLHITANNVNQRIERYAKLIADIDKQSSLDNRITAIELSDVEKREFQTALSGKIYELTARRRNYLILRLDSFLADGAATYDPTVLTIEHVLPQTVQPGSEWERWWPSAEDRLAWVHKLANLVPLTQKRNSSARNFDFDTKKTAYFGGKRQVSSYVLTTQVLATDTWQPETLHNRQASLLATLNEKWVLS